MSQGRGWNSSQAIGVRILFIILGWVIGVILFGTDTKGPGDIPAFVWCGMAGLTLAFLLFNDYFTQPPQNIQNPQTNHTPSQNIPTPQANHTPSQNFPTPQANQQRICVKCFAPFIKGASFCPNCGNKLS